MLEIDDAEKWTVVVNRKAPKAQRGVSNHRHGRRDKSSQIKTKPEVVPSEADEALILKWLKRSMDRLKDSQFFSEFVDQTESSPVRDNLFRAVSVNGNESRLQVNSLVKMVNAADECIHTSSYQAVSGKQNAMISSEIDYLNIHSREEAKNLHCKQSVSVLWNNPSEDKDKNVMKSKECDDQLVCSKEDGTDKNALQSSECGDQLICSKENVTQSAEVSVAGRNNDSIHAKKHSERVTCTEKIISCFQIVLYGVGSIADSEVSRCQLALVLLLKERFSWVGEIFVYDPVLSESEFKAIQAMGCSVIDLNEEGRHSIDRPTLFYMPHCEDWLYDNVLHANWVPQKLKQLVILGNSFSIYHERWSSFVQSRSKSPPNYVLEFHKHSQEIPLKKTSFMDLPAFNDLSWHFYQT